VNTPIIEYFSSGRMRLAQALLVCVLLAACNARNDGDPAQGNAAAEAPDAASATADARVGAEVDTATGSWPTHGLDFAETRFSRLDQINERTVSDLGLVWTYDLESTRGVETTPLIVDGTMYATASWSVVHAIDARTGERRWTYDPQVPHGLGSKGCCDVVNRGVALSGGKVFVGTFDGRLVALEAATGRKLWEQDTVIDPSRAYTITGAPRVYEGKVLIGNGGAEYGVRGYISAYDEDTGALRWRWYTVPGDPNQPYENDAMVSAARTWDPSNRYWQAGGGGTVWDTMAFDPELNLIYIGTGNGSPWNRKLRSPAGGDNLYLASIVALDADTGEYAWHYQETPGDSWDYTSTQPMILADIELGGELRKVILHAPKNGFFFVVDRTDGSFISADPFVDVNWATGYGSDGRPIEVPAARGDEPYDSIPGAYGAHNWHPMSYNPQTGLAYFPAQNVPLNIKPDPDWKFNANLPGRPHSALGWNLGVIAGVPAASNQPFGRLIAWDPVARQQAWSVELGSPWNGGTLTSAGNLVFQGTADGRFVAYDARDGRSLWESPVGTGIVAGPVTYQIDGVQYVSVAAGWGGVYGLAQHAAEDVGPGTVFTYVLGGDAPLPEFSPYPQGELVSGVAYDPAQVDDGAGLYVSHCFFCHGVPGFNNGGNIPNLGYVRAAVLTDLDTLLADRAWVSEGMPDFSDRLSKQDVAKLRAFIQATAEAARPQ
jgi:quinohemoprotein ethanol dehydrogenase